MHTNVSNALDIVIAERRMLVETESTALSILQEPPMTTTHQPHVVTGAGPVGATVALQLAERGIPVRLLTRSGSGPEHELIDRRRVDVSEPRPAGAPPRRRRGRAPLHPRVEVPRQRLARRAPEGRAGRARAGRRGRSGRRLPGEPLLLRPGRRDDHRGHSARRHPRQARDPRRPAARPGGLPHAHRQRRGLRLLRPAGAHVARRRAPGPADPGGQDASAWWAASTSRTPSPTSPTWLARWSPRRSTPSCGTPCCTPRRSPPAPSASSSQPSPRPPG